MSRKSIILLISLFIWVISYNIWEFTALNVYYIGTAQMVLVASWIIHTTTKEINHVISRVFLFLAFNNLADELFFDPTAVELNEYIMVFTLIVYSLWKWRNTKS